MQKRVYVFLADGFEEIEGVTVVDLLRRADIKVETVSIMDEKKIHGAHNIDVMADCMFSDIEEGDMLVLPGGLPGTDYLEEHKGLRELLTCYDQKGKYIAAICAAPRIFGHLGFLNGRKAISYPAMEGELEGAIVTREKVVVDGHVITSRGMGTAIPFALALISLLEGEEKAQAIGKSIIYNE